MLERFLKNCGVREPEREHILLAEQLVFSEKPSAKALFPQGIAICRNYDRLEQDISCAPLAPTPLQVGSCVELEALGLRICCENAEQIINTDHIFTVQATGPVLLRSRQEGDRICLSGGHKSLKKLFIDRKIPAARRPGLPVVCDDTGILGVYGIGADCSRMARQLPALQIRFEQIDISHKL
jgi:tRNA(Ile)-lysidine synthase